MDSAQLADVAGRIPEASVLVWGDLMLDAYLVGSVRRISPEAPVPVIEVTETYDRLGGAANAAANCAALGARTRLVGVTGADQPAERLHHLLGSAGVEGSLVASTGPTTVKQRLIASHQQVARVDFEEPVVYTEALAAEVADTLRAAVASVDAVLVSDYAKGAVAPTLIDALVTAAAEAGRPVVVDPKGADFARYRGATVITPNEKEAREGSRSIADDLDEVVAALMGELPGTSLAVTRAEHGVRLFRPEREPVVLPARARSVADVTGAGDTVAAVMVVALAVGADLEAAVALANVAAGISVEHLGTHAVTADELADRLALAAREH